MFNPWVWKIPWRRKWQPAIVFLPGKSHRQKSLVDFCPWGHKRVRHSLTTKQQQQQQQIRMALYPVKKLNQQLITYQTRKQKAQMASLVNFIKYLREKLCQLSVISSRRQKQKEYFLTYSMKLHYSNSKSKDIKRKLQTSISHELKMKISSTNINKSNAKMYEKNYTHHVQRDLFHVGKGNLIP